MVNEGVRGAGTGSGPVRGGDPRGRPRVVRNDYSVLEPPPLGEWEPDLSVCVVVPAYGGQEKLDLTLAALSAQSYPSALTEVVVVDDGSEPALRLPPVRPEHTRLIAAPERGWGPGHAVGAGVEATRASVVMRLDADVVVGREHVEAQMRWHHLADYLVVMGGVEFGDHPDSGLTPAEVYEHVRAGRHADLTGAGTDSMEWITEVLERTDGLRDAGHRAWQIFTGATASLPRALYSTAGGSAADLVMGEDSELGYRLSQRGAVFVPEPLATGLHLGRPTTEERGAEAARFRRPFMENRVPRLNSRRVAPKRTWQVPFVDVEIDTVGRGFEDVTATVDALLAGDAADIRVTLVGQWSRVTPGRHATVDDPALDVRLVHEHYRCEPRVRLAESEPVTDPDVPFRLLLSPGVRPRRRMVRALTGAADREGAGLVLVRGSGGRTWSLRLERTAAFARARHLGVDEADRDAAVAELWGVHELDQAGLLAVDEEEGDGPPKDWHRKMRKAEKAQVRWRTEAERWERRVRALTQGRGAWLLLMGLRR
ncbi:glycosyltransferase family 2 protein [Nocardiopsis prasina]|uniref:glycosyltransferase family 2 protein n=1 Tax=Nocardiopsis prasina TaxID=2015 RepID=UPI00034A48D9|nr:glycosyltransferase family 2 protein [Nocardiopsis prasina]